MSGGSDGMIYIYDLHTSTKNKCTKVSAIANISKYLIKTKIVNSIYYVTWQKQDDNNNSFLMLHLYLEKININI